MVQKGFKIRTKLNNKNNKINSFKYNLPQKYSQI